MTAARRQRPEPHPARHDLRAPATSESSVHPATASAVYEGWVRHRRYAPHPHAFRYRMAMLYLDLAELPDLFAKRWLWSDEGRNLAEFRRSDFLGPAGVPLDEAVRLCVAERTGRRPAGPIRLLTHLRYAGHIFNPVSFYYCYDANGRTLQAVVAEITNTPWKERHAYVLLLAESERHGRDIHAWTFDKTFHVSPFMPMRRRYDWRFSIPGEVLRVHMNVLAGAQPEFDATLVLHRRPLDSGSLARVLWRFPLMTLQVVFAIHWQALRLWLKRNPVHDHPDKKAS